MCKRIACGVVVFSLLMLWPVAQVVAEEEEAKMIGLLEELYVFPDKADEFEALFKEVKEVFIAQGFPYRFDLYALDDLRYLAIWWVEGTAGIDKLDSDWAALAKEWGEEASADWMKKAFATMSHTESSVWIPRPDLSYRPENETDEYNFILWGLFPIKMGHQQEVEELFKEFIEVYTEHKVPHAWSTAAGTIGVESPTLGFVEWSATQSSYWMRNEELEKDEEFSAETGALWEQMSPHIRGFEQITGRFLKDLSYRPKKKVEAAEEK
jgi:hypothetical protein